MRLPYGSYKQNTAILLNIILKGASLYLVTFFKDKRVLYSLTRKIFALSASSSMNPPYALKIKLNYTNEPISRIKVRFSDKLLKKPV